MWVDKGGGKKIVELEENWHGYHLQAIWDWFSVGEGRAAGTKNADELGGSKGLRSRVADMNARAIGVQPVRGRGQKIAASFGAI